MDRDGAPLIVGITGMPGAGKTTAAGYLSKVGYGVISMGDVIRDEVRRRGLKPGLESQLRVMELVRKEHGPAALAVLLESKITSMDGRVIVIDGIRSPEEVAHLGRLGSVRILAIHASPARRFEYLRGRGRHDDPHTWEEFRSRDFAELSLRIGEVIALADGMIVNERATKDELGASVVDTVRSWVNQLEGSARAGHQG